MAQLALGAGIPLAIANGSVGEPSTLTVCCPQRLAALRAVKAMPYRGAFNFFEAMPPSVPRRRSLSNNLGACGKGEPYRTEGGKPPETAPETATPMWDGSP